MKNDSVKWAEGSALKDCLDVFLYVVDEGSSRLVATTYLSDAAVSGEKLAGRMHGVDIDPKDGTDLVVFHHVVVMSNSQNPPYLYLFLATKESKVLLQRGVIVLGILYVWDMQGIKQIQIA